MNARGGLTWVNGRPQRLIDCRDRGLQYGDGLFETMRVRAGRIRLIDHHLERLHEGCRRLALPAPSAALLRRELVARARRCDEGVMKLLLTRGPGARGYRPTGTERCTRVIMLSAGAPSPAAQAPQRVRMCATRLGSNPALAGLKTLNRLESVLARSEWRSPRIWEGLMCDADGNIVCGTMSNLFVRCGAILKTPVLDRCGIAGVMRRWVLEQARELALRPWQGRLAFEDIVGADELFMTNAVAGIVSVARLEHGRRRVAIRRFDAAERLRARLDLE